MNLLLRILRFFVSTEKQPSRVGLRPRGEAPWKGVVPQSGTVIGGNPTTERVSPYEWVLGIDASRANKEQRTGTEWYSYLLIEHLKKIIPADVAVHLYSPEPLRGALSLLPPNWESRVLGWPPRRFWTLVRLSWEMLSHPPDLLFVPAHGLPLVAPKRTVVTIHDIGFERFPELYRKRSLWYHRFVVRQALRRANTIITISEWTKQELGDVFRDVQVPIVVTPLAHESRRYHSNISELEQRAAQERYGICPPYFIFVGRLEKKKNVGRLLEAFARFLTTISSQSQRNGNELNGSRWSLVLVGPRGYGFTHAPVIPGQTVRGSTEAAAFTKRYQLNDQVKVLNWVPESDIPALMAGAVALVFPTLYEGFGMPILEAMAVGTPVITSDHGAVAEVAGKAALFVDPEDVGSMAAAMQRLATDTTLVQILRQAGWQRSAMFDWDQTAKQTWQVLKMLA